MKISNFKFQISNSLTVLAEAVGILVCALLLVALCAHLAWSAITLQKANFAVSTLDGGITNTATSVTLADGSKFPGSGPFRAVLWASTYSDPALDANAEIVNATISAGDTFTLVRGLESTTAVAWSSGDNMSLILTKGVTDEWEAEIGANTALALDVNTTALNANTIALNANTIALNVNTTVQSHTTTLGQHSASIANAPGLQRALVTNSSSQAVPNGAITTVNFPNENKDTDGFHGNTCGVDDCTRLTCPWTATVRLAACIKWDANTTGERFVWFLKNGGSFLGRGYTRGPAAAGGSPRCIATAAVDCSAGEHFQVQVIQTSGGSLNIAGGDDVWFELEVISGSP